MADLAHSETSRHPCFQWWKLLLSAANSHGPAAQQNSPPKNYENYTQCCQESHHKNGHFWLALKNCEGWGCSKQTPNNLLKYDNDSELFLTFNQIFGTLKTSHRSEAICNDADISVYMQFPKTMRKVLKYWGNATGLKFSDRETSMTLCMCYRTCCADGIHAM